MSGNTRHIDTELNKRYEDIKQLYDNMKGKWVEADYRIAIFGLLEHGCFCPDCLYSELAYNEGDDE